MRDAFADEIYAMAQDDARVVLIAADISPAGKLAPFVEQFPGHFVNVGVSEQIMISMCAGLALRGFRPFAYTIATFAAYRPFEQIRDDLGYQELPVTVVGIGGGVTYSVLGGTHHAMEDVSVIGSIPGMTVIAPCDPAETRAATRARLTLEGPCYLRLGKSGEPDLTSGAPDPFEVGRLRTLRRGEGTCIIGYGPVLRLAFDAAVELEADGIVPTIVSAHTLKPFDAEGMARLLADHSTVIVLEEHVPRGGLASLVKETAWETDARCRIETVSLQDRFIHVYGSHDLLIDAHGISAAAIAAAARPTTT